MLSFAHCQELEIIKLKFENLRTTNETLSRKLKFEKEGDESSKRMKVKSSIHISTCMYTCYFICIFELLPLCFAHMWGVMCAVKLVFCLQGIVLFYLHICYSSTHGILFSYILYGLQYLEHLISILLKFHMIISLP